MSIAAHSKTVSVTKILARQNLFQRLGFNHNRITDAEVSRAYKTQLALLASCADDEVDAQDRESAKRLLREAFESLKTAELRARYTQQLESNAAPRVTGLLADRYRLENKLNCSERTQLFQATDLRLNRKVVVKCLDKEVGRNPQHRQAFRKEAELFAGLSSSHLVKLLDFDASQGAIVMERMSGDLQEARQGRGMEPTRVCEILQDVLRGLLVLHNQNITHGRIDLSHLLVDASRGVKLAITPGMSGTSFAIRPESTTWHLAPELLNSRTFGTPGVAVDLYALGFVGLELLCGKQLGTRVSPTLGDANSQQNWLNWHSSSTDMLPNVEQLVPGIDAGLAGILQRMTHKQQHQRYANAQDCLLALRATWKSEGESHRSLPPLEEGFMGDTEVDILGDGPYLEDEYQQKAVDLSMLFNDPALLLRPEGRAWLLGLGTTSILSFAMLVFFIAALSSPSANNSLAENQRQEREGGSLPNVPEPKSTNLAASKKPKDALASEAAGPTHAPQLGQSKAEAGQGYAMPQGKWGGSLTSVLVDQFQDQLGVTKAAKAVEEKTKVVAQPRPERPVQTAYYDPYFAFCIRDERERPRQVDYLLRLTTELQKQAPQIRKAERARLYELADYREPFDPRLSYAVALLAYRYQDLSVALKLSEKSIRDAGHWKVPFGLPMLLESRILTEQGRFAIALDKMTDSIAYHNQDPRRFHHGYRQVASEQARRLGEMLGFLRYAKSLSVRYNVDVDYAHTRIRRVATDEQLKIFNLAQSSVKYRVDELAELQPKPESPSSQSKRQGLAQTVLPGDSTPSSIKFSGVNARKFRAYAPVDTAILARRVLASLQDSSAEMMVTANH